MNEFQAVLAAATSIAALAGAMPAAAADLRGVGFAGGSVGGGINAYAGTVNALGAARLGKGWGWRLSANGGHYDYGSALGRIEARYAGADAALVRMDSGEWGWVNWSAGPRITRTRLSPGDPDNRLAGTRWDLGLQADGMANVSGNWRIGYLGSVGVLTGAYLARVNVGPVVDRAAQTRLGIEASLQGDPRYRTKSIGLFGSTQPARSFEVMLGAGLRDQETRPARPYVSLGTSLTY